jgi:hypothetical protein
MLLNEVLKNPLNALTFLWHEVMVNKISVLFFPITLSVPFVMNTFMSGNTMVAPEQGSDSEITEEMIANAISSLPDMLLTAPSHLVVRPEGETNAPAVPTNGGSQGVYIFRTQ